MPESDLNSSKAPLILGTSTCLMVVSVVAVALRFLSRKLSGAGFWWDDWMCMIALVKYQCPVHGLNIWLTSAPAALGFRL